MRSIYARARVATHADDAAILRFFDQKPMDTARFVVAYKRAPSFFELLRYQSDDAFVLAAFDDAGEVRALGTITVRDGWLDGAPTRVAYLGDLRVGRDRTLIRAWRTAYSEVLLRAAETRELAGVGVWITAVMEDNRIAKKALVAAPRGGPTYVDLARFSMRSLLARLPFVPRVSAAPFRVVDAAAGDHEAILTFFEAQGKVTFGGFRGALARRLAVWPDFGIERFVLVKDARGAIVGCTAPWAPSRAKSTVVARMPRGMELAGRALEVLPGRPWMRLPRPDAPLRIEYLTCFEVSAELAASEREHVAALLVEAGFDRARERAPHIVAVADYDGFSLGRAALRAFVTQSVPIRLYTVRPPGSDRAPPALSRPPGFEMALV